MCGFHNLFVEQSPIAPDLRRAGVKPRKARAVLLPAVWELKHSFGRLNSSAATAFLGIGIQESISRKRPGSVGAVSLSRTSALCPVSMSYIRQPRRSSIASAPVRVRMSQTRMEVRLTRDVRGDELAQGLSE